MKQAKQALNTVKRRIPHHFLEHLSPVLLIVLYVVTLVKCTRYPVGYELCNKCDRPNTNKPRYAQTLNVPYARFVEHLLMIDAVIPGSPPTHV